MRPPSSNQARYRCRKLPTSTFIIDCLLTCRTRTRVTICRVVIASNQPLRAVSNVTISRTAVRAFYAQHGIVIVGDRVLDDRERIAFQSVHIADGLRGAREAVGDDGDGRDAEPFCFNRVVQTARRAAPSIADRGEDSVRSAQSPSALPAAPVATHRACAGECIRARRVPCAASPR